MQTTGWLHLVFLREQSCKSDLELDALCIVSQNITAPITCKVHKMWQTTNNLRLSTLPSASHCNFHPYLPVAANYCVPAWDPEGKFSSHGDSWTVSISRHTFLPSRAGEAQLCWEISRWHLYLQYRTQPRRTISNYWLQTAVAFFSSYWNSPNSSWEAE